jgi:retinol dehydrogenase-12
MRTFLVTGANSGVGRAATRSLAARGARVVMVCRNPERGAVARDLIRRQTGNDELDLRIADLASLGQVRSLARDLAAEPEGLHGLVNNAGVVRARKELTEDGFERTMATNHLAHFVLTHFLLERLIIARGRVVNVASESHRSGRLERAPLETIMRGQVRHGGLRAYSDSKLANVLFSNELARRYAGRITSNAVHPGVLATRIWNQNKTPGSLIAAAFKPLMGSPDVGGRVVAGLAADPRYASVTGKYFDGDVEKEPAPAALDVDLARRLWSLSARLTGVGQAGE